MTRPRLLLVLAVPLALAGCRDLIVLDDLEKPFACTPSHLDGGLGDPDGGSQCGAGWRCGYAGRCFSPFDADAGRDGPCELDEQCFDGWTCGPRVGETRRCQRVGVGAPSACRVGEADAGCQGGWRCGADARCFDPANAADAGARDCTESTQCPDGFRCGQRVSGAQRCIAEGVGAEVPCTSDEGCEGGWRCDTLQQVCAAVTDVVTSGRASALQATRVSPLLAGLPAPRHFAATFRTLLPASELGALDVGGPVPGVTTAALYDGGAWVATHLEGGFRFAGSPERRRVVRRWVPVSGPLEDVLELATQHETLFVLFGDGGLTLVDTVAPLLGPPATETRFAEPVRFVRQVAPLGDGGLRPRTDGGFPLLVVAGDAVAGGLARFEVGFPFAGEWPVPFSEPLLDAVPSLHGIHGFAPGGHAFASYLAGFGSIDGGWSLPTDARSRAARAGLVRGAPAFVLELAQGDGGAGLVRVETAGPSPLASGPLSACPDAGEAPLQVAFGEVEGRTGAVLRCQRASLLFRDRGGVAQFDAYPEDQAPFAGPLVSDRTATFGRAHAGSEGRAWLTAPPATGPETGSMVDRPLRPELLDRQPDVMVGYFDGERQRTFAQAGSWSFADEPGVGLLVDTGEAGSGFRPLALASSERLWVTAEAGVFDLAKTAAVGGAPRQLASAPVGERLSAPGTGAAFTLQTLDGPREVVVVASGDRVYAADLTAALPEFGQPATLATVLVPSPGLRLRGLTLDTSGAPTTLVGYVTTGTATWRFSTSDLVSWALTPMTLPPGSALAAELWSEGGRPRLGLADGTVWSLPIAVRLAEPLRGADGGVLSTVEFGHKCGDLFATTREGVFHLRGGADGGLPAWAPAPALNAAVDVLDGLRLYEVGSALLAVSRTGRVVELTGTFAQADGGTCR